LDIELLKTFLEIQKTRHFGRAAENLFLTPAAVSARIKQLEQFLGVVLFVRKRGDIQLTSEGERLVPHAETILLSWSRTVQDVALQKEVTHRLHIGATYGLWQFALHEKLLALSANLPELAIRAEGYSADELIRKLQDRTLDIVLLYEPPTISELKSTKLGQLRLVMASNIPGISAKKALHQGYIYVDWGTSFEVFHANKFGEAPPAVLSVNMANVALSFLENSSGSAYLPERLVKETPSLERVKGSPTFARPIYAMFRESHDQPDLLQNVISLMQGLSV